MSEFKVITSFFHNQTGANTSIIKELEEGEVLLFYPLTKDLYFIRNKEELNLVPPTYKDFIEKNLSFLLHCKEYLNFEDLADLNSILYFYVLHRYATGRQKRTLSEFLEKIAKIKCGNSIKKAYELCVLHKDILITDDFNSKFYKTAEKQMSEGGVPTSKALESCVYRMAGFVMAQTFINPDIK